MPQQDVEKQVQALVDKSKDLEALRAQKERVEQSLRQIEKEHGAGLLQSDSYFDMKMKTLEMLKEINEKASRMERESQKLDALKRTLTEAGTLKRPRGRPRKKAE